MNPIIFAAAFTLSTVRGWNMRGSPARKSELESLSMARNTSSILNQTTIMGVCWEAMTYKKFDLNNVTAVFKPAFWERDYPEIKEFCSSKGNGTFCYRPSSQKNDSCLDMAVVRCPEGVISACHSNFICKELVRQNVTCDASVGPYFNTSYSESGQARCEAIEDVIKLPPALNVTTTVDEQNNTVTIGKQIFDFPFVISTTVDCTFSCISTLPTGFPQPTKVMTACYNDSLPYDQWLPKTTCVGPYPPGPMTTVTETICNGSSSTLPMERTSAPTAIVSDSIEPTSSDMVPSSISQCPVGSPIELVPISESPDSGVGGAVDTPSMSEEVPPTDCGGQEMASPAAY